MHLAEVTIYLLSACSWFCSAENFHFVIHSTFGRYGSSLLIILVWFIENMHVLSIMWIACNEGKYEILITKIPYFSSHFFPFNFKKKVELFFYGIGLVKSSENLF